MLEDRERLLVAEEWRYSDEETAIEHVELVAALAQAIDVRVDVVDAPSVLQCSTSTCGISCGPSTKVATLASRAVLGMPSNCAVSMSGRGTSSKNASSASSRPADAPMPTT